MACISEGEVPASTLQYQLTSSEDDAGITARLAKKLITWTSPDAGKLEVIRPGTFTAQYIRSTGLKTPVLIKGDRFNESPQLGLMWPDVHNISVEVLSDYIGGDRKVDTWDVVKQRPGPAWTLSQWCTYWHARLDAATRQAKPATAHGAPGMLVNDDDDEEGEVVDSGVVIVLQGVQGAAHNRYKPAPACVGISPDQAQRLLDGECLPLHGSQLCQHIHPPPAIQSVDLVRQAEKDLEMLFPPRRDAMAAGNGPAKSDLARGGMGLERERETSRDGGSSMYGFRREDSGRSRVFPALAINPADTLHLQMTPKDCFSDFRMAPGGAATWLYVLQGLKVVVLLPPTLRNRRLFLTWATATRANQPKENVLVECLLADYAEGAVKVQLKASQALVIPAGWFYASAAMTDTLAVGCYFWHPYCLADSAKAQQMELQLKLKPQRFTLPARNLLWYAGIAYGCKLRKEFGLQELALRKDTPGAARRSVSEASLNQQQQRASPYLRGMAGQVAATGSQQQRQRLIRNAGGSVTPGNTPPLTGLHAAGQLQQMEGVGNGLGTPKAAQGKRGRQSDVMEHLYLGDAAVPVAAAAAAEVGQQQQHKRIKLVTGKPVTPLLAGVAGGTAAAAAGVAAATQSTPRSNSRQQNPATGVLNATAGLVPSNSNHSRRQQHMPGSQRRYAAALIDDDDDDECHTSPVRRLDPEPVDHVAAAAGADGYVDWDAPQVHASGAAAPQQQQQGHVATAEPYKPITALRIRVPGKAQPLYSPVIQPMKGDLDSIPQLHAEEIQQPAVTPPAAAAARKAVNAANGPLLPPAAVTATPGRKKLTLKGQATPTAAAAAAAAAAGGGGVDVVWPQGSPAPVAAAWQQQQQMRRRSSPDQDSSAGSHAVVSEATHGTNASSLLQQQQGHGVAAARGQHQQQRRMVLERVSDDEDDVQQQPPVPASMPQQQRVICESNAPRPPSTAAAAAAPAAGAKGGAPLKLKFKLMSPSPNLTTLQAPQSGAEVPPVLLLDGHPAAAAIQQRQQQGQGQVAGVGVIPQVDGSSTTDDNCQNGQDSDVTAVGLVLQGQYAMQQLFQQQQRRQQPGKQAGLWARWQKLQSSMHAGHHQQQQQQQGNATAAVIMGAIIPQVDGASEDGRPNAGGPTLVLQPAAPAAAPVTPAAAAPVANGLQPLNSVPKSHKIGHGHGGQVIAAVAGGPASLGQEFVSSGHAPQQQGVVHAVAQTAANPAAVKQQQQLIPALPTVLRNHAVNTVGTMQQQQATSSAKPAIPAATAAVVGHSLPGQQGLVLPRNPMLQPQVQKLKQAVAGRTASPPNESGSPRDKMIVDTKGSAGVNTAVAVDNSLQQQQQGQGAVVTEGQPQSADPVASLQGPMSHWNSLGSRQGTVTKPAAEVAPHAVCASGDLCSTPIARASRAGSNNLLTLVSPPALAGHVLPARRSSLGITGDSSQAAAAAAGECGVGVPRALPRVSPPPFHASAGISSLVTTLQQQPGSMGPPPPTKLSVWELVELPVLLDLLQEQVSDRIYEIQQVAPVVDAELVVQQLQEAVGESRRQRDEQQQQQQQAALRLNNPRQQQGEAMLQQVPKPQQQQRDKQQQQADTSPGPLVVLPLTQNEMPPGLWEHIRLGQQLLRANGALLGHGMGDMAHDATTEVVGEHDPHEGSAGATSLDNRSAGSIGGSRGVAAAAGGAVVGRGVQHHQATKRGALPRGEQQAKDIKKQKIKKGLGIIR